MCEDITAQELKFRISKGETLTFIDVREEWEYEELNIGARCIPLYSLPNRMKEVGQPTQEIIVHCKSGTRGKQACKFLVANGFENVRNLAGGLEAYLKA